MSRKSAVGRANGAATTRCAIYTRKSSEEGLEQDFNSLDAQREACQAFILSQKGAGWMALPEMYDDGGLSGGSMERPALQRLLADIQAGRVDTVVVYKVDRLTRSLNDFAKIVDAFDAKGVAFVSVTQQFNTTTSMGRLTLNMLLSFAQFEREVTSERIRDKIAASQKGMWMGGLPPLGYDVADRRLVINRAEADTVRHIFRRYTVLKAVRALQEELDAAGMVSKARVDRIGRETGAKPLARGALYLMLQNRIYRGEIVHRDKAYPGLHAAIIDAALWDAVQAALTENRIARVTRSRATAPSLLAGLVFDESTASDKRAVLHALIARIDVHAETVDITLRPAALPAIVRPGLDLRRLPELTDTPTTVLSVPARVRRTGMETRLLIQGASGPRREPNRSLVRLLAQARRFSDLVMGGNGATIAELAARVGVSRSYFTRVFRLSFLSPEITKAILQGRQPPELIANRLMLTGRLASAWSDQRRRLALD
jgi:DNA invertase Pin-like site-specific DNA recombinase/AraC-like DNA-binding protein